MTHHNLITPEALASMLAEYVDSRIGDALLDLAERLRKDIVRTEMCAMAYSEPSRTKLKTAAAVADYIRDHILMTAEHYIEGKALPCKLTSGIRESAKQSQTSESSPNSSAA